MGSLPNSVAFIFPAGERIYRPVQQFSAFDDEFHYFFLEIAAAIAYCDYVFRRYGRFPAKSGPFRSVLAFQAHNLDPEFYSQFYLPEAVGEYNSSIYSG